jgi:hypothetical protein
VGQLVQPLDVAGERLDVRVAAILIKPGSGHGLIMPPCCSRSPGESV